MHTDPKQSNFHFLAQYSPLLLDLAFRAECYFSADPNTALIKLRQFGEALAQYLAADNGISATPTTTQADLLGALRPYLDRRVIELFHLLRRQGNEATHDFRADHATAKQALQAAWELAKWFHTSQSASPVKIGAYKPLPDPGSKLRELQDEIERTKAELLNANQALSSSRALIELERRAKEENEQLALAMDEEARQLQATLQALSQTEAQTQAAHQAQIQQLQQQIQTLSQSALQKRRDKSRSPLELSEELTRVLIDQQLRDAGWQADSKKLRHGQGTRPQPGQNLAIAEYPTADGVADYVLFHGLTPLAAVEAKKQNTDVPGKIPQAEGYARNFPMPAPLQGAWALEGRAGPWPGAADGGCYTIPFAYSCNGRPYVKQYKDKSGTWFRDLRSPANTSRALQQFHSPEGLQNLLKLDQQKAQQQLAQEPWDYLALRDYQIQAIQKVEQALAHGKQQILIAMATGTGKTRTTAGLLYRLLKAQRFARILFLVDRTALGDQALTTFGEMKMEQGHSLQQIYAIADLSQQQPDAATRIHVATVQAMVKRVLESDTPPPIDQYDCIVVDEAHRGYTLDQDMTEGEYAIRAAEPYLSTYRRVLEYFDATRIALTATPAKHTTDIFGAPIYTYSYRQAVIDDWLIDHEPPIRYETLLTQNGIHFKKGETVNTVDLSTGQLDTAQLADELHFDVDDFNRGVITEGFNRVICQQLATELPLDSGEKTLIFCANDAHADMVKRLLDEAFTAAYGADYNQASVAKITGQSPNVEQLIRHYKNEAHPTIAITVDLLTTGIDVPAITHLVFLRRVRSRILFEQMLGRATRRCDAIGKTAFHIYDPVDIYAALDPVNTMRPLVRNPNISLAQLLTEIANPATFTQAQQTPGAQDHPQELLHHICQKLTRALRKAQARADHGSASPQLRQQLETLQTQWGMPPQDLPRHLRSLQPAQAAQYLRTMPDLAQQIESLSALTPGSSNPVISPHSDQVTGRVQTWGDYERPEDYLESFTRYLQAQRSSNQHTALMAAINSPRNLTREDLKTIRQLLDEAGYSEARLQSAYKAQTNEEIAAGIVAHIRRAALGEPLIPFEQRLQTAMRRIYSLHPWTRPQRQWLERLGKRLLHDKKETMLDRELIAQHFVDKGGAPFMDQALNQQLDAVLAAFNAALWPQQA